MAQDQKKKKEKGGGGVTHTPLGVERRRSVEDNLNAGGLDDLIEGIRLRNIGHDDDLELLPAQLGVGIVDLLGLVLGPDGRDDLVALLDQLVQDVGCWSSVSTIISQGM